MNDQEAIERCIELARISAERGNHPFGSLITRDGALVAEGENLVLTELDPTAHAETVAIRNACRAVGSLDLTGCTLYTSCEPCWICSTAIRDTGIARVVFAGSSNRGGYSSIYPILRDPAIARYGAPPEVLAGLLVERNQQLWAEVGWPKPAPR